MLQLSTVFTSFYHHVLSLVHNFAGEELVSIKACESRLAQKFLANRDEGFYERHIYISFEMGNSNYGI